MRTQLSLRLDRRKNLISFIAVASFTAILAPNAKATTWTIIVTAVGTNSIPTYSVSPPVGGCPFPVIQDPKNLYICPGDTVQWQAATSGTGPNKMHNKMWIFHEDFILLDEDGDPTQGFHATDAAVTKGGTTDPAAVLYVPHKYHVSVFDKLTKLKYSDDPKIIIGGTNVGILINFVKSICVQLPPLIDKDKDLDEEAKKLAIEGCRQFRNINHLSN
jgi:hypothetical protein